MQYSNVGRSPSPPGTGTGTTMTMTPTTAALGQQHSVAQFPASTGASIIGRSPNANTIALDSVDISRLRYSLLATLPISISLLSSIICFIVGPTGTTSKSRNKDDDVVSTTQVRYLYLYQRAETAEHRSSTLAAVFSVFFIIMIPFILITIVLLALLRKINARNKCLFTTYIRLGIIATFVITGYVSNPPLLKSLVDGWNGPNIKPYHALVISIIVQGIVFIIAGIYAVSEVYGVRRKLIMRLQAQMDIQLGSIMTQSLIVPQYPVAGGGAGGTGTGTTTSTPLAASSSAYYNNNTNAYPPQEQPA